MSQLDSTLPAATELVGGAVFLEAAAGPARTAALDEWLDQARQNGATTWRVDGDVEEHGVWAGLQPILLSVLPLACEIAPDLVERHSYELCLVLPALRRTLPVRNPCLTDVAVAEEKVRNFANDRAYRSLHGLIEFLDEWHALQPQPIWAIACDHFDRATTLVWRFFAELLRRRGSKLRLALLLAIEPGALPDASALFERRLLQPSIALDLPCLPATPLDPTAAGCLAAELEAQVGDDRIEWSIHMPRLLRLWQSSDTPWRALPWLLRAINLYDHDGLYEVAIRYAPAAEAQLGRMFETDRQLHALTVLNLFFCYAALGQAERGHRLLLDEGLPKVEDPLVLIDIHYFLGMLHARFLKQRDLDRATAHLDEALALIPRADLSEPRRHFLHVFVRNGLAYVRFRQGRADDALALCDSGLQELEEWLKPDEHRLHRSVLLYNAAQVLAGLERYDTAMTYLSQAMLMDPNYSEYYLERGGLLLRSERFEEAEADLLRAIDLSPPYAEVWTDLGQCYRACGRMLDAERAYSHALDLDPRVQLALIGRAEAVLDRGDAAASIDDYTAALALAADQPLVLAGRAVAYYEAGRPVQALQDLNRAIELEPATPEFFQNRAVALVELGRPEEARRDLETYLQLAPDAADRDDVEYQLTHLAAATPAAA